MRRLHILIVSLLLSLFCLSCTSRNAYNAMQERNKVECLNLPDVEYEKCMARTGTDYDTYEKQRKELEKTEKH